MCACEAAITGPVRRRACGRAGAREGGNKSRIARARAGARVREGGNLTVSEKAIRELSDLSGVVQRDIKRVT